MLGIGEGQLAGEVLVTGQQGCQGVAAIVGRQHNVHHGGGQRLDVTDQARTAFVEDEHDGLARGGQFAHQLLLVVRQVQVVHIAGGLAVGVLTHAAHNDVGAAGGFHRQGDVDGQVPLPVELVVHHAGYPFHLSGETVEQGLEDGVVLRDEVIGRSLPGIAPAAVQRAQAVGVGAADQDLFRSL